MRIIVLLLLMVLSSFLFAQDKTDDYKQVEFIKLNESNDLFTYWFQSDKYYTDGIHLEFVHRIFNNKVADKVLLGFDTKYKDFGLSFNHDMYTPQNTQITTVDSTDRPYAGQLYFVYKKVSNQFFKGRKLSSALSAGVQGPAAMAGEAQNFVHEAIDNPTAKGWDNQLSNGIILDYEVQYMAMIPLWSPINELHYFGTAHLGALNMSTEIGFRFKFGRYTDSYMNYYGIANDKNTYDFKASDIAKMNKHRRKIIPKHIREQSLEKQAEYLNKRMTRKFQFYFFTEGILSYIIRDGSVEGSLIQFSDNIYEYNYDDYDHTKILGRYGVVLQYSHFYLEYARYLQNDSFQQNGVFGYGKIILSWIF